MISETTQQSFIWCVRYASWLNCIPVIWNKEIGRLCRLKDVEGQKRPYRYYFWLIWAPLNILIQLGMILFLGYTIRFGKNIQPEEIILALYFMGIFIISTSAQVFLFQRTLEVQFLMNSILDLNRRLGLNWNISTK
jgi:hypothetical protein